MIRPSARHDKAPGFPGLFSSATGFAQPVAVLSGGPAGRDPVETMPPVCTHPELRPAGVATIAAAPETQTSRRGSYNPALAIT